MILTICLHRRSNDHVQNLYFDNQLTGAQLTGAQWVVLAPSMCMSALGDNCQNFNILLDLKICDNFASNDPIDLKLICFN